MQRDAWIFLTFNQNHQAMNRTIQNHTGMSPCDDRLVAAIIPRKDSIRRRGSVAGVPAVPSLPY